MNLRCVLSLIVCLAATTVCRSQPSTTPTPRTQALSRADIGVQALQRWYDAETGLYRTTGWWNSANATTAIIDFMRLSGSRKYVSIVANTYTHAQVTVPHGRQAGSANTMTGFPGFLNNYYDDEGWWALAWIDAYDLTGEPRYLASAQSIFKDMAGGWDDVCGGGIWWSKDRSYKNAIANELFLSVAAHLATRGQIDHERYADWAAKELRWFEGSGMINDGHLVNDGLSIDKKTGSCRNNRKTVWTYNQGVLLGALAEWSKLSGYSEAVREADMIANASLLALTDKDGVLHETCEPVCGADGVQFKGIFMRNLRELEAVTHNARYRKVFETNADSIWTTDRGPDDRFGVVWSGPSSSPDAGTQSSAVDAFVAAIGEGRPL